MCTQSPTACRTPRSAHTAVRIASCVAQVAPPPCSNALQLIYMRAPRAPSVTAMPRRGTASTATALVSLCGAVAVRGQLVTNVAGRRANQGIGPFLMPSIPVTPCEWTGGGDGGPATLATLCQPFAAVTGPSGDIFIADTGNRRIRRVNASSGIVSTVVGSGSGQLDASCDETSSAAGDGGPATLAAIRYATNLAFDSGGSLLYVVDGCHHSV